MGMKLVCMGLMMATPGSVLGQPADIGDRAVWPHMHQCTVTPGPDWQGDAPPIPSIGVVVKKNVYRVTPSPTPSRIDLEFTASRPSGGGAVPIASGFAITTKGTGTSAGRVLSEKGATATVACVSRAVTGDDIAQPAWTETQLQMRRDASAVGWSCSVSGGDGAPRFVLTLLVPTILGQAERIGGNHSGEDARLETKRQSQGNVGRHRVSIVPRGSKVAGASPIACSWSDGQISGWDVLILS